MPNRDASMADGQLYCCVCPSKPKFSDKSHLLTHMQSKGHLSHAYRTRVLAAGRDEDAREKLREYDEWYNRHGIDELVAARMKNKGKTPTRRLQAVQQTQLPQPVPQYGYQQPIRQVARSSIATVPKKRAPRKKSTKKPEDTTNYDLLAGSFVDVSLGNRTQPSLPAPQALQLQNRPQPSLPVPQVLQLQYPTLCRSISEPSPCSKKHFAPVAHMEQPMLGTLNNQNFNGLPEPSADLMQTPIRNTTTQTDAFHDYGYWPVTPTAFGLEVEPSPFNLNTPNARLPLTPIHISSSGTTQNEKTPYTPGDGVILKGTHFPGMDLFDTAGKAERRKRNQRKSEAAIAQMAAESAAIKPTEVIFHSAAFDLKKARYISGEVESSPEPSLDDQVEILELPKPRQPKKRVALTDKDPNTREHKRIRAPPPPRLPRSSRLPSDHEVELDLTANAGAKINRTRFPIFRDPPTAGQEDEEEDTIDDTMPTLNTSFDPNQSSIMGAQTYSANTGAPGQLGDQVSMLDLDFFDRPQSSWMLSNVRSNIFPLEAGFNNTPAVAATVPRMPEVTHTNQQYIVTTPHQGSSFHEAPIAHMDMSMAYTAQQNPNPLALQNHMYADYYDQGNHSNHELHQEPPLDLQEQGYPMGSDNSLQPGSEDSEATISEEDNDSTGYYEE